MVQVFPILLLYKGFQKDAIRDVIRRSIITYELLEKSDSRLFYNLKRDDHPLKSLLPRYKDYTENLRRKSIVRPSINTGRFFNRLIFKYNLAV